ncbi:hypothetical protein GCM10017586_12850 [Microbacterium imperiale]|uniref:Uncharacterized protein n=1 Tax=Microbacterium imperiale TaxID=33884 RepID=A0A9W6M2K3_9MICO|nr:hypothetical protein GCM10017586_12850 [Microbacterium imperiale]
MNWFRSLGVKGAQLPSLIAALAKTAPLGRTGCLCGGVLSASDGGGEFIRVHHVLNCHCVIEPFESILQRSGEEHVEFMAARRLPTIECMRKSFRG